MPRVCAFKVSALRKAVTAMRKRQKVTGPKSRTMLLDLLRAHRFLPGVATTITAKQGLDVQSAAELRRHWKKVSAAYHKPVSKMSAAEVVKYCYATAHHLDWSWAGVLTRDALKKKIPDRCREAPKPGDTDGSAPSGALPKLKKAGPKRAPTAWQSFLKETLAEMKKPRGKFGRRYVNLSHVNKTKAAGELWQKQKGDKAATDRRAEDEEHERQVRRENEAAVRSTGRIPKKKKD